MELQTPDGYELVKTEELNDARDLARKMVSDEKSFHIFNRQWNTMMKLAKRILKYRR